MLVTSGTVTVERGFFLKTFEREGDRLLITGETRCGKRSVIADRLVAATGFRPDLRILRELRVELDPAIESPTALAPLIDPNVHSCGSVKAHGAKELSHPEEGLYIAGMKSYGRAPTFLMKTGYEQVRSIVAQIAGDLEAAARVELTLPETGVCSARIDDAKPVSEKSGGSKPEIAEVI
jgi:hypothetical protein